jgi:hypothetical protein
MALTLPEAVIQSASRLIGHPLGRIMPVRQGGNNRVHRIETPGGDFCLKVYPKSALDLRDRLGAEYGALCFLARHGIACVPKVIASDPSLNFTLFEWIDGVPVDYPSSAEIDAALSFTVQLLELRPADGAADLPLASEACLSGAELTRQIEERAAALEQLKHEKDLQAFLKDSFRPDFARCLRSLKNDDGLAGEFFLADLPSRLRCLNPSDFGYHNALRTEHGLVFIDFEYFGWDDPAKLAADFILHPGREIPKQEGARFVRALSEVLREDKAFLERFARHFPLYVLRWCLILLNSFVPEKWVLHRGEVLADWEKVKYCQIHKAHAMIRRLDEGGGL